MKKVLLIMVIAFLSLAMTPNTQTIYSLDKYDGYCEYQRNGFEKLVLNDDLLLMGSNGFLDFETWSFVTFDLNKINLNKAKSIKLQIQQLAGNSDADFKGKFILVNSKDYRQWQNCAINNYLSDWHTPKNCGFLRKINQRDWYDVIRYQSIAEEFKLNKSEPDSLYSTDNLLPIIKKYYKGKDYLTISFNTEVDYSNKQKSTSVHWAIWFADGNYKYGDRRPRLVVTY